MYMASPGDSTLRQSSGPPKVVFGPFEFDPASGELRKNGYKVKLPKQPGEILSALITHPGEVVTREDLRIRLWPGISSGNFEHGVNAAVNKLRQVLGDAAAEPRYIETLPGRGYRFVGSISPASGGILELVSARAESARVAALSGVVPTAGARPWWRKKAVLGAGSLALAALLALGTWFALIRARGQAIDSVAVLPFVNASSDPNSGYLSDGISESIINNLSQLSNLRVLARTTVFRYKGKEIDPQKIGRDLNVRAMVTGRVQQHGDNLIIQAELVAVEKGSQLWGGQFHRQVADGIGIQEEISNKIPK